MAVASDLPAQIHDVFICHASEDKEDFVRPLAHALRERHLDVWYDEFVLHVGDSLRATIDRGLASCRFGVVVLSPSFFTKAWAQRELNGLVARETAEGRPVILPVWHGLGRDDILRHSPPLADAVAISSNAGLDHVVQGLLKRLKPDPSPLVVARDFLLEKGVYAPSVTDEFWLHTVGLKDSQIQAPEPHFSRWMFPLPFEREDSSRELGLNIAWTSLQFDWIHDADDRKICQLTHPDQVHEFLRRWPGLVELGRKNPGTLAMYVPQITIPGFDVGFEDVFDELLDPRRKDAYQMVGYSKALTTDDKEPLCGELMAWRHPTFGNYADRELGHSFVGAYNSNYSRSLFDDRECLVWLLCDASDWMPAELRAKLIGGVTQYYYRVGRLFAWGTPLMEALQGPPSKFRYSQRVRDSIRHLVTEALGVLGVDENPETITKRFVESSIVESVYAERRFVEEIRKRRRSRK